MGLGSAKLGKYVGPGVEILFRSPKSGRLVTGIWNNGMSWMGTTGFTGCTEMTGTNGLTGTTGDTGWAGMTGLTGTTGWTGMTGTAGFTGATGDTGWTLMMVG